MSAIQDLAPFIEAFPGRIRKAKDEKKMTVDELAEQSGASFSAVSRLYSGTQANPQLYNAAAMCKILGLSLDELFGLEKPTDSPSELQERNHKLEIENARLVATNEAQSAQIKSIHSVCYILVFFCVLLAMSLVVYLVIDSQITDAGIIRGGELSFAAWMFIALIIAAILAAGSTISRIIRKENQHEESQSPRS